VVVCSQAGFAVVRDIGHAVLETRDEIGAFGQVLLAEFILAGASAGITGMPIRADVEAVAGLWERLATKLLRWSLFH
jgi:hypothetical protein